MQLRRHFQARTTLFMALLAFFLILTAIAPPHANAAAIDFTRFLSKYVNGAGKQLINQYSFFGVPGSAD